MFLRGNEELKGFGRSYISDIFYNKMLIINGKIDL